MQVQEFLERSAERFPDKAALIAGSRRFTFSDIDAQGNRLANFLSGCGIGDGDRVVVLLDNCPETVISIFGVLKADSVFVVINPSVKADKLAYMINNCRAAALITHSSKWSTALKAAIDSPSLKTVLVAGDTDAILEREDGGGFPFEAHGWDEALGGSKVVTPGSKAIDIDLAALIYTSGTTGHPKGVMLTHLNIVSASTSITAYLENRADDIILNTLPLSFDYGLYQILMAAQFGGTVVLERSFTYPYAVIELLKREKVTGFPIVPTMAAILLQMKELKKERFEHLRYITNTAAALPASHINGLRKIFEGARIYSMYGLTECKRVSYLPPEELDRRPTSVGRGMPNEQVYLVDGDGRMIDEPGVDGELVVRGANVMKGYWELPEETERMLRPGRYPWEKVLYTGDIFRKDEEGFLYFVSRRDDIIKSRGEKVSPKEVENVIYELPDVIEAAVVGVPDEILGESIKAFIVLKRDSELTDKDIISHCMKRLEDFMVPKVVEFKEALDKTSSGKISKKGL